MTATATIETVMCVNPATGTDLGQNGVFASLFESSPLTSLAGPLEDVVKSIPGIVDAIDRAGAYPDDLFITADNSTDVDDRIWPLDAKARTVNAGQSVAPGVQVSVPGSASVSLVEYDSLSANDLLGAVTIFEEERGMGDIAKLAKSEVEGSFYYVTYRVD
ncbi:hypothetical protein GCM10022221_80960 [Actinocorallia aurea]